MTLPGPGGDLGAGAGADVLAAWVQRTGRQAREWGHGSVRGLLVQSAACTTAVLTAREMQILRLIAAGWTNNEIAGQLFISPLTCKPHVSRILVKLEAGDRIQLVVLAYESGLVIPGQTAGLPGAPPAL